MAVAIFEFLQRVKSVSANFGRLLVVYLKFELYTLCPVRANLCNENKCQFSQIFGAQNCRMQCRSEAWARSGLPGITRDSIKM
jgi:hypothetical protein